MKFARTVNILAQNQEYFIADLDNGGVRIGLLDGTCFDFPSGHSEYRRVKSTNIDDAEDVFDEFFARSLADNYVFGNCKPV